MFPGSPASTVQDLWPAGHQSGGNSHGGRKQILLYISPAAKVFVLLILLFPYRFSLSLDNTSGSLVFDVYGSSCFLVLVVYSASCFLVLVSNGCDRLALQNTLLICFLMNLPIYIVPIILRIM